jgi:peptidoglycan hydrolase-like protein with peptidoglycan-binding domain
MRVLKLGCVGADVANWQQFLISRHLDPGGIDGDYGNRTETATEQFQQEGALVVDGIVGDVTVAAAIPLGFQTSPNTVMIDTIIDIFHQNNIDFDRVKAAGIVAIIHKATEGSASRMENIKTFVHAQRNSAFYGEPTILRPERMSPIK